MNCPYCHTPVVETSTKGRHVNGIKPVSGDGCEFCNPKERSVVTERNYVRQSPEAKAVELGAKLEGGINWTWAKGFPSPEVGQEFVRWLEAHGYEHRGYYPAYPESSNDNLHVDGVRFR